MSRDPDRKPPCRKSDDNVLQVVEEVIALVFDTEQPKHTTERTE
jgi:hypothetical protein